MTDNGKAEVPETTLQEQTPPTTFVRASEMDVDASELSPHTAAKRLDNAVRQLEIACEYAEEQWLQEAIESLIDDTEEARDVSAGFEYEERDQS